MRTAQLKHGVLSFLVACVLALLVVGQIRAQRTIAHLKTPEESAHQAVVLSLVYDETQQLREAIADLQKEEKEYDQTIQDQHLDALQNRLREYKKLSGDEAVTGEGIEIVISSGLSALSLLDLVNSVRNSGAEVLMLNSKRIYGNTAIRDRDGEVWAGTEKLSSPYVLTAAGDPVLLYEALTRNGGTIEQLKKNRPETLITVQQKDSLLFPSAPRGVL